MSPALHPSVAEYAELELVLDKVLPGPLTVRVPPDVADASELELTDAEGTPVALLTIESYAGDHVTGSVAPLRPREDGLFRHLRRTPAEASADLAATSVAALVLDRLPDDESVQRIARAAKQFDAVVLLPTLLPGNGHPTELVRGTLALAESLSVRAIVVPVPVLPEHDVVRVAAAYGTPIEVEITSDVREVPKSSRGTVVFFTGLSGSGKSTLARRLRDFLAEHTDRSVLLLDGDVVRRHLSKGLGFSKADRETNIQRIGYVAAEVARPGGIVICAPIAPYEQTRAEVRRMVEEAGANFVLVYVSTPLEECERRDRKGLYAKARAGEIKEFTGISDPYEEPTDATLVIDTTDVGIEDAARQVLSHLVSDELITVAQ